MIPVHYVTLGLTYGRYWVCFSIKVSKPRSSHVDDKIKQEFVTGVDIRELAFGTS
jgi:hypothetical protein